MHFFEGQHTLLKEGNGVVKIQYKDYGTMFDREGKVFSLHDKPVLTLVRRPKKMVKKEVDCFVPFPDSREDLLGRFGTITVFKDYYKDHRMVKAKLIYEIESEEEQDEN